MYIARASAEEEGGGKHDALSLKHVLRHSVCVLQSLQLSFLCYSHDAWVGIAGMAMTLVDLRAQADPHCQGGTRRSETHACEAH